jgi:phytoene synthase
MQAVTRELVYGGFSALVTGAVMIARRHDIALDRKMLTEIQLSLLEPLVRPLVPMPFRSSVELLWRLDDRLLSLSTTGREPALRQVRLAWWRDALESLDNANARVPNEPLLQEIAAGLIAPFSGASLAEHADARLTALSGAWAPDDVMAAGRSLFAMTAQLIGEYLATGGGAAHGLMIMAQRVEAGETQQALLSQAARQPVPSPQPRALAVLDRLARSIARSGGRRSRAREQAMILRVGLLGR